ncbi:hypothetical protein EJ02DRAFT_10263 [Clathrospora elynae]|uniref:CFEM domain-containing protein n=1 Tax=Clathrospora elynae TaxID=706981 RepID=A0A6A5TB62_9PLEO|nr:hypothetical protein EJ02DRAFT_10263 [Clathrospora elynae]
MRFQATVFAVAASLAMVGAQDLSGIPSCALPCFVAALPGSNCAISDTKCQCTTGREAIQNSLLTCAPQRCQGEDITKLAPAVEKLCEAVGVTISDVPTAPVSSGYAAPTGSASMSASMSHVSGSKTASKSASATGSGAPAQTTNAAAANVAGMGALAMGMAAVFL